MAPSQMKAIKVVEKGKAEIQEVPLPKMRPTYILVKVNAVALNPTDWKHIDFLPQQGATVGCDYAGVVEEVGAEVTKDFKKGDRIAGFSHGVSSEEQEDGTFGQYAMVKGDIQIKIPDNVTDDEAATLGVGISTVGQGLYQSLGLPLPGSGKADYPLLVYGGSTATGTLAIQFAKLSGCDVITTCSPRNFDLVKSLGASAAFDYNDKDVGQKIRDHTKDSLTKVFDTISEGSSPKICCDAISTKGGVISYLLPAKHDREDVENKATLAYTITGEGFKFAGNPIPANPTDFEEGKKFWDLTAKLLAEKKIQVHPPQVGKGGLEGVFEGLKMLKEGKVSGTKLVYHI